VPDVAKKQGVSAQTIYAWRKHSIHGRLRVASGGPRGRGGAGAPDAGRAVSALRVSHDSHLSGARGPCARDRSDVSPVAPGEPTGAEEAAPSTDPGESTPSDAGTGLNHVWAYDFVFDMCADGRTLKCLTVIDEFTRECLAIDVAGGIRSGRVIEVLTQLVSVHGAPQFLRSDNGPEFVATAILRWLQTAQIETAFIDPGKPWQNGADESFNGKFRDQHLSLQWFRNRTDAKVSIEARRRHYYEVRPHSSLSYLTPAAFKAKHLADVDEGRSPALPARADMTKNGEPVTGPLSAILQ
jgi:putative transposase